VVVVGVGGDMQCCTQAVGQAVPILLNPATWALLLAALAVGLGSSKKKGK
jgi:hypothetical protein